MVYSHEVQNMCCVAKGPNHGPAPIPEEGKWVQAKEIKDISGLTHGIGWCAPQQGACKLTLNVKDGVIEEALVETIGCSGMTHSAAMASEILPGKTILEALNTDLVCDAINTRALSPRPVPSMVRRLRALATCSSPKVTSPRCTSTRTTRFAVTSSFTWASSWMPSRKAFLPTRP